MKLSDLLLLLVVVAIWGFNFVALHIGIESFPPLFLCFLRFFFACFPFVFFIKPPKIPFRSLLLYGSVMFVLQFSLLFSGMHEGVSAGLAGIILQSQVFFTIFFAYLFLGEKVKPWQILGALISFAGIVVVGVHRDGHLTLYGLILVLAAAANWGVGSIIVRKIGKVNLPSLVVWGSLVSWPPLLVMSLYWEGSEKIYASLAQMTLISIGAIVYISYLSTLLCFVLWNYFIQKYPMAVVAPFTFLTPVFGMISAAYVLDEPMHTWKLISAFLIIAGLVVNMVGDRLVKSFKKLTT